MLKATIIKKRRELTIEATFTLESGSTLAFFGPSGAGKSTVLACLAGIDDPDEGYIQFQEVRIFPPSLPLHLRPLGYLTQEPGLFPHLTVRENVLFGARNGDRRDHSKWIQTLRERLRLTPFWNVPSGRISGGQARRVAMARMLARRPALVLLDEPFAGLDRQSVRELIDDLVSWSRDLGFSMIAVDHQPEVLERLCPQHVMALEAGSVVQRGSWSDLRQAPATPLLRSLLAPL